MTAARRGDPMLRITPAAKSAVPFRLLFPRVTNYLMSVVSCLLPDAANGNSQESRRGFESVSSWSPSVLTALTGHAAARNNQLSAPGE